ncbi:MAG: phage head morphogenesis protein [Candidatus Gastranaerophilales bacterium]|nr:phage head morphogenesis protein [Candidatus Gastranaerophilales bacterium]
MLTLAHSVQPFGLHIRATEIRWHEVYEDAHAKAFTVAKMTEIDLLSDTKKLLEKALDEGKSYSSFKKEASELFEKKGWVGFKEVKDPKTGEIRKVELGTPRRIKTIYDCNMRSSYAVGRYKEQLEEIDVAPIWQYKSLMDGHERPEHRAMHNKAFMADDPFWGAFYPPNGSLEFPSGSHLATSF